MKIGIDAISFYAPGYHYDLELLAKMRKIDPNKYLKGLNQVRFRVAPKWHDAISLGANAALQVINEQNLSQIDLILFATESGTDFSKAGATILHELLNLKFEAKAIEIKQACFGITAAIDYATGHIIQNPMAKVLIIGSDLAKYGVDTPGEPTQGAGAVAMIVAKDPKIMIFNQIKAYLTKNAYDFWRPNNCAFPLVDGKLSTELYLEMFEETFNSYLVKSQQKTADLAAICFHIPYSKLAFKALDLIEEPSLTLYESLEAAIKYNQQIGNIYTGSLYLNLISLLENKTFEAGAQIGLYSYGSGAVAQFFSGKLVAGYQEYLNRDYHHNLIESSKLLTYDEYQQLIMNDFFEQINQELTPSDNSKVYLSKIVNYQRQYKRVE